MHSGARNCEGSVVRAWYPGDPKGAKSLKHRFSSRSIVREALELATLGLTRNLSSGIR